MRYLIASARPERVDQYAHLWNRLDWDVVWLPGNGVRQDFYELALQAVTEQWNHETVILQDDMELLATPEKAGPISVYSGYRGEACQRHVCPRAFSCSPEGWARTEFAWRLTHQGVTLTRPGEIVDSQPVQRQLCVAWTPDFVVDIAVHHGSSDDH